MPQICFTKQPYPQNKFSKTKFCGKKKKIYSKEQKIAFKMFPNSLNLTAMLKTQQTKQRGRYQVNVLKLSIVLDRKLWKLSESSESS